MNRLQLAVMVLAAVSVLALLVVTVSLKRWLRLMLYCVAIVLLGVAGGYILATQPWYSEHWGYFNLISGIYMLLLAVAPAWAGINLMRREVLSRR